MLPAIHKYDDLIKPLAYLQKAGFESAIIAGGCFRDIYHGWYPRDIDIFVWDPTFSNETTPLKEFSNKRKENPGNVWRTGTDIDTVWIDLFRLEDFDRIEQKFGEYDEQNGKITAVWDIWKSAINFQVIMTKVPPIEHMERNFNIGLCKVYCDGVKVRFTGDFMRDATNKTLTIVGENLSQQEYDHTVDIHIPRLRTKYPHHTIRHSEANLHYSLDKPAVVV